MIFPLGDKYRDEINKLIETDWSGPFIISNGFLHDTRNYGGFVSVEKDKITGYTLYHISNQKCEIVVLQSFLENQGVGSSLINSVKEIAKAKGCDQIWLITTNDNIHAIRFYQKFGFELSAVHINAMEEARKQKPSIPLFGNEQIPIKHEFEFSLFL